MTNIVIVCGTDFLLGRIGVFGCNIAKASLQDAPYGLESLRSAVLLVPFPVIPITAIV